MVKCIVFGGMAGYLLKAAAVSTEITAETIKLTKWQIEVTMIAAELETLEIRKS